MFLRSEFFFRETPSAYGSTVIGRCGVTYRPSSPRSITASNTHWPGGIA